MNDLTSSSSGPVDRKSVQLEICCGDIGSVLAAQEGSARRIELCSGLTDGGLTPSVALIRAASECGIAEINVLIRPRPYDFLYSGAEVNLMCHDIEAAVHAGATGIVIGALKADGNVDRDICSLLIQTARDASERHINITFHRAFDVARDADSALSDIIELGCDCLLTSGMADTAEHGIPVLHRLVERCESAITIMAGGGVNCGNAAKIITATGVGAIHSTARTSRPSGMMFRREDVPMGAPGMDEYTLRQTDPETVSRLLPITKTLTTCER